MHHWTSLALLLVSGVVCYAAINCPTLPPPTTPATNVNQLHPGDIKVVMAMGDSITAGFGIQGTAGKLNESRGLSASIGGDANAITLANFLRFYSPNIQGPSVGQHIVELCYGNLCPPLQYEPKYDVLNSAQSGAMVENLVTHELDYLVGQLKANTKINIKEDWKVLTVFIGANDLCSSCSNKTYLNPDTYEAHMLDLMEGIRKNIPRVFVQIVEIFNLSQVYPQRVLLCASVIHQIYDLSLKNARCANIHRDLPIECPCVFDKDANASRLAVDNYSQLYNARAREVAAKYQALAYPEFNVVAQPAGRNTALKVLPVDMLSTLDCFHPSLYGHQVMATALWYPYEFKKSFTFDVRKE